MVGIIGNRPPLLPEDLQGLAARLLPSCRGESYPLDYTIMPGRTKDMASL